jgi:hypothetical protein
MTEGTSPALVTRYVMMTSTDGVTWKIVGQQAARQREAALKGFFDTKTQARLIAESDGGAAMQFVAVAESSFRPVRFATKLVTTIKETKALEDVGVRQTNALATGGVLS